MKKLVIQNILLVCILSNCYENLSAQTVEAKNNHGGGWGWAWKWGYSQYIASNNLSRYLNSSPGGHTQMDILYKRFGFCGSTNFNFSKARNVFTLSKNNVNLNDKVEVDMAGFSLTYAVIYTNFIKISPIAGTVWGSLTKDENTKTKGIFTETIGLQIEFGNAGSLGGLTGGFCLPLYLKYNYSFPKKYNEVINSGMHFITIGLELYIKGND